MTIRGTKNGSIIDRHKHHASTVGRGESIELVGTAAGKKNARDRDARVAGQTATPGNAHNGPRST